MKLDQQSCMEKILKKKKIGNNRKTNQNHTGGGVGLGSGVKNEHLISNTIIEKWRVLLSSSKKKSIQS